MTHTTTPPSGLVGSEHFHRQWHRLVLPSLITVAAFVGFANRIPGAVWIAIPSAMVVLGFCALLHGGLILSSEGIDWYVIHPRWRYRRIPWHAVRDVQKGFFGLCRGEIQLHVNPGRYEPWVWGTPNPDQPIVFVIRTVQLTHGEAVWDAIHNYWLSKNPPINGISSDEQQVVPSNLDKPTQ